MATQTTDNLQQTTSLKMRRLNYTLCHSNFNAGASSLALELELAVVLFMAWMVVIPFSVFMATSFIIFLFN